MTLIVRQAETDEDRLRVYEFRYHVYVEEMHFAQRHADHLKKTICEPSDRSAKIVAAFDGDEVVGTVRGNAGGESDLSFYPELYGMRDFAPGAYPDRVSVTTKLMVSPRYRNTMLAFRLAAAIYRIGLEDGVLFDFIDCEPHLIPFYQMLGYVTYRDGIQHPDVGIPSMPLVLPLTDAAHLERIGSPFAKMTRSFDPPLVATLPPRLHLAHAPLHSPSVSIQNVRPNRREQNSSDALLASAY